MSVRHEGLRRKRITDGPRTRNGLKETDGDKDMRNVTTTGRTRESGKSIKEWGGTGFFRQEWGIYRRSVRRSWIHGDEVRNEEWDTRLVKDSVERWYN